MGARKKSEGEAVGRAGAPHRYKITGDYFKGNSQNGSAVLYNCRTSILWLGTGPNAIRAAAPARLGARRPDKEGFQQRRCQKRHASDASEQTLTNARAKNN